jgi:hypothetical protein
MKTPEEVEKLASKYADGYSSDEAHASYIAFQDGYTQCQEDNKPFFTEDTWNTMCSRIDELQSELSKKKYTEEDIREAIDMARQLSHVSCLEDGEHRLKYSNTEDDIINSLNKQDK